MSGSCTGVQTCLKKVAPNVTYIHCYALLLNLVLVDCAKAISHAAELFCLVESLYVLTTATKAHTIFISKQQDLHTTKQPLQLKKVIRYKVVIQVQSYLCSMSNNYKLYDSFLVFEVRCCLLYLPT